MLRRFLCILLLVPIITFADEFIVGKDYEVVNDAYINNKLVSEKVAVTEFFSYGCPWCYRIEFSLNHWVTENNAVQLSRVPVIFNKEWIYYAKAYYTAELLGLGDKLNPLLFKAVQVDKQPLTTDQAMIDFFITHGGVEKDTAMSAFSHSTIIDLKINKANLLMSRYHINSVPAIVINGRYKTDLQMAKGEERLFKILDYLIAQP